MISSLKAKGIIHAIFLPIENEPIDTSPPANKEKERESDKNRLYLPGKVIHLTKKGETFAVTLCSRRICNLVRLSQTFLSDHMPCSYSNALQGVCG